MPVGWFLETNPVKAHRKHCMPRHRQSPKSRYDSSDLISLCSKGDRDNGGGTREELMMAFLTAPRPGVQPWKYLALLVMLLRASCAFNVAPTLLENVYRQAGTAPNSRPRLFTQQNDNEQKDKVESKVSAKIRKRCPDFPSWAMNTPNGEGVVQRETKVRVKRQDDDGILTEDTSSWVYKAASELPLEPRFFLDVANSARRTRLLKARSYATPSAFSLANITCPPSLQDLDTGPPTKAETFWISTPARLLSLVGSIWSFPFIIEALDKFVTMQPAQLQEIASSFAPGISIIYGTFVSLTLSVLYNRQQGIQDDVAQECALLTIICRNLLMLFVNDKEIAIEAAQAVADQIRILVKGSRGAELTLLMYSDPYSRMLELIAVKEGLIMGERNGELGGQGNCLASCRDLVNNLVKIRAKRLSDEALALPPTHFFVLTTLTILILLGYCVATLPTVEAGGAPSFESSVLFGVLFTVYVFFYNFTNDLNNPFQGVYQIRRSSAATHLLEIKWLLANHRVVGGEVDFEEIQEGSDGDVMIRSPGLGDLYFEKEDIYIRQVP